MTRPTIIAAFVVGAIVTAWVGRQYQGTDSLALSLVVLIAVVFVAGLVECWLRAAAIAKVNGRAAQLSSPVSLASVENQDPELGSMLAAQGKDPSTALTPLNFAPFAVGLVVLLGLLGTFMGLVDTIAGAQNALGATTDVDSLRAALLAPMHGLTRAFGTSVAGVATSALLGFAQVMVRREENALFGVLSTIKVEVDGETSEGTQLSVLKEILAQGASLNRLLDERLEERLGDQLSNALQTQDGARQKREDAFFTRMVETTQGELQKALTGLEGHLEAKASTLTTAFAAAADGFGKNSASLVESVSGQAKSLLDTAAKESSAMRQAAQKDHAAQQEIAKSQAADAAAALGGTTEKILAAFETVQRAMEANEAARGAAEDRRKDNDLQVGDRLLALTNTLEQSAERQEQWSKASADALKDASDRAGSSWSENALVAQQSASDAIEKLSATASERLVEQQARLATFEDTLAKERNREQELAASRSEELAKTLERLAEERAEGIAALEEALDDKRATRESETAERLSSLAEKIDARFGEYIDSLTSFEAKLEGVRAEESANHAAALKTQAEEFAGALSATGEAVQNAAGHVGAGGMELEAVAEMFAAAVDKYRDASDRWLESIADVAQRPAGESAAPSQNAELMGGYLDQTRAAFDESLKIQRQMQQEMFSELKTLRGEAS